MPIFGGFSRRFRIESLSNFGGGKEQSASGEKSGKISYKRCHGEPILRYFVGTLTVVLCWQIVKSVAVAQELDLG